MAESTQIDGVLVYGHALKISMKWPGIMPYPRSQEDLTHQYEFWKKHPGLSERMSEVNDFLNNGQKFNKTEGLAHLQGYVASIEDARLLYSYFSLGHRLKEFGMPGIDKDISSILIGTTERHPLLKNI